MTLTTRTGLRPCGKLWGTEAEALVSKLYLAGGREISPCTHGYGGVHLARVAVAARTVKPSARRETGPSQAETFSEAVCLQIDLRDGDDTGAALVRLCQRCGSTRNLHRHHRRLKGYGGSRRTHAHCACVGVTVCGRCHDEIHASPKQAMTEGWIVSRAVRHPGSVGVMRFAATEGGATHWPSCDGRWLETAAEALEAVA